MFPPAFDYAAADSVADALELHAQHEDAVFLAGGHSLLPALKEGAATPGAVVDVGDIEALRGVTRTDDGLELGAVTTYAALAADDAVRDAVPALADALSHLGDRQIRNRGTVGGNLAAADAGADLPPVALAVGAELVLESRDGTRTVPAREFFDPAGGTTRRDGELLTEVRVPSRPASAYVKKTHPASGYALVGAAAAVTVEDGEVTDARVAATGVTDGALPLQGVADALTDGAGVEAAAERAPGDVPPGLRRSDPHASGEYRASVLESYVARALDAALDRAEGR